MNSGHLCVCFTMSGIVLPSCVLQGRASKGLIDRATTSENEEIEAQQELRGTEK